MGAIGAEGTEFTVALVGGRRFREQCLARYLETNGVRIVIGSVDNLRESLCSREGTIDIVVIDTGDHTCSDRSIAGILACLRDVLPGLPVVVVSDREDWPAVLDALCHAVRAYFPSSLDPEILLETLRFVQRGGTFVPAEVLINGRGRRNRSPRPETRRTEMRGLTPSEQRVLELLREGKPNKVIARELDIEETTVKVHVRRIMKKLTRRIARRRLWSLNRWQAQAPQRWRCLGTAERLEDDKSCVDDSSASAAEPQSNSRGVAHEPAAFGGSRSASCHVAQCGAHPGVRFNRICC